MKITDVRLVPKQAGGPVHFDILVLVMDEISAGYDLKELAKEIFSDGDPFKRLIDQGVQIRTCIPGAPGPAILVLHQNMKVGKLKERLMIVQDLYRNN